MTTKIKLNQVYPIPSSSSETTTALNTKANISDVETALSTKANSSDLSNYVDVNNTQYINGYKKFRVGVVIGEQYNQNDLEFRDANGNRIGFIRGNNLSDNSHTMSITSVDISNNTTYFNGINLTSKGTTKKIELTQAPDTSDDSNAVATTSFVKAQGYNTKVNQLVSTANGNFPILFVPTNNASADIKPGQTYFGTGIKANPSTSTITANTFNGSLSGNATSATAFSAAKSVTLTGAVTGTVSSTAGWSVPTIWRSCMVGQSGSGTSNPWYKVATIACTTANWDPQITFLVEQTYNTHCIGILRVHIRTGSTKVIDTNVTTIKWLLNSGFTAADFVLVCPTAASSTAELWTKIALGYTYRRFVVLSEGTRTDTSMRWTLLNASSAGQAASITTSGTQKASS